MKTYKVTDSNTIIKSISDYIKYYYKIHNKAPLLMGKHPFSRKDIQKYFGNWTDALIYADIPLNRNKVYKLKCKLCKKPINKQYKEFIKTKNDFCSHQCSASFNNTGRRMSLETREKIKNKLMIIRYTNCKICDKEFSYRKRKRATCGDKCLSDLKKYNNDVKYGRIVPEE